ncbi:unnamed protein product [Paramecium octaurelia]|uniref:PHD-type domain-containing protein n=1 Tax=Paramecium octaurelia TaxID=43137 RepID=A0A8S1VUT8_PAROT|nr:unnamed protein product [Paramecium octaurelia]
MNCSVCGLNFERKDKGCQQMECQQCKLKYHRFCYGYNNLDGVCDPCQDIAKKPLCCICGQKGLLKRLSDQSGVYVHVSCAIFAPHIQVINYHTMTFATKSQIDKKTKEKCSNCGKSGANIQCLDCQAYAHPHCIFVEQVEKAQEDIETEQWIFHLKFQANNQDPNQLDVESGEIKCELKEIQDAFYNALDKFQDKQKKRGNQTQQYKEHVKNTLESIFDNYTLQQCSQQWSSQNKIESYCQVHMESHRLFCICRKSLNNKQMVQCDHCYEWYHFGCIKRKNVKDDSYICEACKGWSAKRTKIDLEDPKLLNFEDLVVPKSVYILHLIDLLPLLLYIEAIMKRLPSIPLDENDYRNIKFYKLFLASLPIKPSTVIQLDKILLKEKLQEELKQKMHSLIPTQLEQSEQFAEELVKSFKFKGYYFELGENKLIKSFVLSRKDIKVQIQKGISEGYLMEDTFKILNENVTDNQKIFKSPNDNLGQLINRYKVAQQIKTTLRSLFEAERMQIEYPVIDNQLDLTVYKQMILMKNQKNKPNKLKLIDLKRIANHNNVTLGCLKIIDKLLEELNSLEQDNVLNSYKKIIEFPVNSDTLTNQLQSYFEQEFIDEFKVELELKIESFCRLTEKEYIGVYTYENIQKAAKDSIVIRSVYNQLQEIHQKCQTQKKVTIQFCHEILDLMSKCLLTSTYMESQKAKFLKFRELYKRLNESITLEQLEEIEHECFQLGFDMDVEQRRQQLVQAQEIIQNIQPSLSDSLDEFKKLKSLELDTYIKQTEQQIDFVKQLYYLVYNSYDTLPKMIQKVKDISDLDFNNELLYKVAIPEIVYDELKSVVLNFRQLKWRCECQQILDQSNQLVIQGGNKKYNISQIIHLLNADPQIQDPFYTQQLQKIKKEYESWIINLQEFENQLAGQVAPHFNQLIKLINKNQYQDNNLQTKLWQYYIQMLWMQKAEEFIEAKANPQAYKTLISCATQANIDSNNVLLLKLKDHIFIMDDLGRKLKEYQEQRFLWVKSREQINNLQSYKSYYKYLENKPDAEQINQIYIQAKEYPIFKVKDLGEDLQEVRQVLQQYNDLVQKQPDNSLYIQQLQKIRTYYCCCFLKVKNFCVQLMYNMIKQQSLKCLKQLNPTEQILQRLEEINLLVALGGEEWYQKLSLTYKGKQESTNNTDFKFIDCSLQDDFEWIRWMEESSQNIGETFGIETKKQQKEQKIKKKKSQSQQVLEGITEDMRQTQRLDLQICFKKCSNWKQVNEQQIRNLEAQVFMEQSFDKDKYLKEIEKIKAVIKQNKQIELNYEEMKKAYKQYLHQKKSNSQQTNSKQALQLESIKVIKKQQQPQVPQIASAQKLISQHSIKSEPELEKKVKPEPPKQPTIIAQPIQIANDVLLYNPDGQVDTPCKKQKNLLMNLGEINLQIKKKVNDSRESFLIKPQLLTYEHHMAQHFPKTENITVTCESFSPVKEVMEYFTQRKPGQFRMMIGWLYSKDINVAGDLFKLADKLKHSRQCVGTKLGDVGLTLIYYDYLNKLKPTTKWIIMKEELENQLVMDNLTKYHNLEKFKPHLCFVYYVKDLKECTNTILPQPVQYVNVLKHIQFKRVIENHKAQQKKQQGQLIPSKKKELEPISDEENNNGFQQKQDVHSMLMEIPGILSLLNQ